MCSLSSLLRGQDGLEVQTEALEYDRPGFECWELLNLPIPQFPELEDEDDSSYLMILS